MSTRFALLIFLLSGTSIGAESTLDQFERASLGPDWTIADGTATIVDVTTQTRLQSATHPVTGTLAARVAIDGDTDGQHLAFINHSAAQDMSVQAWVFCDGNDAATKRGGYQGIVARASLAGSLHMVRLAWDPDYKPTGASGDGWVKLQAFNGTTWDYLGIDHTQFGSTDPGYVLDGSTWQSGWHLFRLDVSGNNIAAYVDDMETPIATGTLSLTLRNGTSGFYVYSAGDFAGYFDDFSTTTTPPPQTEFDILIENGTIHRDGYSEPFVSDIAIKGDKIAAIGNFEAAQATTVINAAGKLVVPGFIDTHTHADGTGQNAAYLRQGVTTMVTGNCGGSPSVSNLANYYTSLGGKLGTNYVGLVGHNALRAQVGLVGETYTPVQMQQMKSHLTNCMNAGAFGLSTGLIYYSGFNSTTDEVVELAQVASQHGGIYATHMRSEGGAVLAAVEEAITIGAQSGCRVQISHAKCSGAAAWGLSDEYLALVAQANNDGVSVMLDQYPYTASQTTINVLFPQWAQENWTSAKQNQREQLQIETALLLEDRGGATSVYMISGTYRNRFLSDVATQLQKDPVDVLIDDIGLNGANAVYHTMQESDVVELMKYDRLMIGSDGPTSGHPRGSGTFPRFWGHYARDLEMFDHRECVKKTSTLAAEHFRLVEQKRGRLDPGWYADITILDPQTIIDRSTFESPTTTPLGISHVIVNGTLALSNGSPTSALAGRVLRLTDSTSPEFSGFVIQ